LHRMSLSTGADEVPTDRLRLSAKSITNGA